MFVFWTSFPCGNARFTSTLDDPLGCDLSCYYCRSYCDNTVFSEGNNKKKPHQVYCCLFSSPFIPLLKQLAISTILPFYLHVCHGSTFLLFMAEIRGGLATRTSNDPYSFFALDHEAEFYLPHLPH